MVQKRSTLADVAKLSGVSRSTVSLIYNNHPLAKRLSVETVQKVREAIEKLNYHPSQAARNLATGSTGTIGLCIPMSDRLSRQEPWLLEVMGGIIDVLSANGYNFHLSIFHDQDTMPAYENIIRSSQVDGLILYSPKIADLRIKNLETTSMPFILCGKNPHLPQGSYVDIDNFALAYDATLKLINSGHTRIEFVHVSLEYQSYLERYHGYEKALQEHGLEPQLLLLQDLDPLEAIVESIQDKGTTAFLMADATVSTLVYEAAKLCGKGIPEALSLIALDDLPIAPYLDPPLTCYRIPHRQLGKCAAHYLLERILGEREDAIRKLLDFEYVKRRSVLTV